jgi:hypothetical protein
MALYLQGQHRPSARVRATWRFDAPDSTAMPTPRRSSTLAASTQLRRLHDDFDAALEMSPGQPTNNPFGGFDFRVRQHKCRHGLTTICPGVRASRTHPLNAMQSRQEKN